MLGLVVISDVRRTIFDGSFFGFNNGQYSLEINCQVFVVYELIQTTISRKVL